MGHVAAVEGVFRFVLDHVTV